MPVKKVYYKNPYLKELETETVSSKTDKRGTWFTFKETIFYPQGGGQSSDKGWVDSYPILDVQSSEDEIWHLVDASLSNKVLMRLDWDHRYKNMQQHSGQHILSACFKKLYDLNTTSVHLGDDITMIELDTAEIEDDILENVEEAANRLIRDNISIESIRVNRSDLEQYSVRRTIKTQNEPVRLVRIGELDCVGCGGIHVRSTAEIGLIKIIGLEKIRGHIRVKIKIGSTAYHYFGLLHKTIQKVSNVLTTSVEDLYDRIESLLAEKRELISEKKRISSLWLSEMAKNLNADEEAGCFELKNLLPDQLKILSERYLDIHKKPCLFTSEHAGQIFFYIRFPGDLNKNVQDFIQKYKKQHSLKGGGARDFGVGQIEQSDPARFSPYPLFLSFKEFISQNSGQ